jgi:hypothetical protein
MGYRSLLRTFRVSPLFKPLSYVPDLPPCPTAGSSQDIYLHRGRNTRISGIEATISEMQLWHLSLPKRMVKIRRKEPEVYATVVMGFREEFGVGTHVAHLTTKVCRSAVARSPYRFQQWRIGYAGAVRLCSGCVDPTSPETTSGTQEGCTHENP